MSHDQNPHPGDRPHSQSSPSLGLNIDKCIIGPDPDISYINLFLIINFVNLIGYNECCKYCSQEWLLLAKKCQQISAWQMINLAWTNAVFVKKIHNAIKRQSSFHFSIQLFKDDSTDPVIVYHV